MLSKRCATSAKRSENCSSAAVTNRMACQSRCEIQVQASRQRLLTACSKLSTRPSPRAWAWAYPSVARSSKPTADGCGRSRANRRVLSFSLRSLPPERTDRDRVDVALWHQPDMPTPLRNTRSRGQSGKHLLASSFSGLPETDIGKPFQKGRWNGYDPVRQARYAAALRIYQALRGVCGETAPRMCRPHG